jgi:hypothetical protein
MYYTDSREFVTFLWNRGGRANPHRGDVLPLRPLYAQPLGRGWTPGNVRRPAPLLNVSVSPDIPSLGCPEGTQPT